MGQMIDFKVFSVVRVTSNFENRCFIKDIFSETDAKCKKLYYNIDIGTLVHLILTVLPGVKCCKPKLR